MSEPTSGPEPTEERRPTSDSAIYLRMTKGDTEVICFAAEMTTREWVDRGRPSNLLALLAAEPEHLSVFHVVEGRSTVPGAYIKSGPKRGRFGPATTETHWHVRVVARNGKTLLSSETYTERRGAVEDAHEMADLAGCRVVDDQTGEDA